MPLRTPRVLIIDDNRVDGIKIAESIWKNGYPVRFIEYDPGAFIEEEAPKLKGVRVVFMDIDLIGEGVTGGGSKIFTPVQIALKRCLDERNGPYILITWSRHDNLAEDLIHHLQSRMPIALQPILCRQLDKEEFTSEPGEDKTLTAKIAAYIKDLEAIGCLIGWEERIQDAASETIQELMDVTSGAPKTSKREALKKVLFSLAKAEGERTLNAGNAIQYLHSILSHLLHDQTNSSLPAADAECGKIIVSGGAVTIAGDWHRKMNAMLHLDFGKPTSVEHAPGDVFEYPVHGHGLPIPDENTKKFLRGNFMNFKDETEKKTYKPDIEKHCKLLLVEITPSCDYSQKKYVWHRYIVAAQIPHKFIRFMSIVNRQKKTSKREKGKLPDYLWASPEFQQGGSSFVIFFNSRLIVSIPPDSGCHERLGNRLFRIRHPLLGDMLGWLARQSSRLGHVSILP